MEGSQEQNKVVRAHASALHLSAERNAAVKKWSSISAKQSPKVVHFPPLVSSQIHWRSPSLVLHLVLLAHQRSRRDVKDE